MVAPLIVGDDTQGLVGKSISHYQIISLVGKGGMGEVYRARDTKLDRTVALKILPEEMSVDADRMRRFVREAKAASALNHSNVAHIYEIGESDGVSFIAMEYVEGQTLAAKINGHPLETGEIVDIGSQIADALDEAHSKGITHRDIKPANVMLTPRGQVKVLDFGLAKIGKPQSVDSKVSTLVPTTPGVVLGTVPYMSPEQALGHDVDHRTDLFSLGVVLYEMATGRLPFSGANSGETLDRILHSQPEAMARFNYDVPADLERIVRKCLEKERERRYQSARELLVDLKNLSRDRDSTVVKVKGLASKVERYRHGPLIALALLALSAIGVSYFFVGEPSPPKVTTSNQITPFTTLPGSEREPTFAPDGNSIAFTWDGEHGNNTDIYVKQIGNESMRRLTTDPAVEHWPRWSPDGRFIAFIRQGGLFLIPSLGGAERKIATVDSLYGTDWASSMCWTPDGEWLALMDRSSRAEPFGIWLVARETGEKRKLTTPPAVTISDRFPAISPDGKTVVFARAPTSGGHGRRYLVPMAGGEPQPLHSDQSVLAVSSSSLWSPDGRAILFPGDGGLWKAPVAGGAPERIEAARGVINDFAVSAQGTRLALVRPFNDQNIWRISLANAASPSGPKQLPKQLIASTGMESSQQYSRDGSKIVFASDRSGSWEIWMCDSGGQNLVQLTSFKRSLCGSPRWSPDGRQIVFDSREEGNADIYVIGADGGKPRRVTTELSEDNVPSWSGDGSWIYFCSDRSGSQQIWKVPATGGPAVQITKQGGFDNVESPDGQFLYFARGRYVRGIWRMPVAGGDEVLVLDQHRAGELRFWTVTEQGIYFASAEKPQQPLIEFYSFATGKVTTVATLEKRLLRGTSGLAVSPDGRWLAWSQIDQVNSDIMLIENFR